MSDAQQQSFHAAALHDNSPTGNQAHQPENSKNEDGHKQELRVVQEGERVVPQESDVGVVDQGGEVEGIAQEGRQEVAGAASE